MNEVYDTIQSLKNLDEKIKNFEEKYDVKKDKLLKQKYEIAEKTSKLLDLEKSEALGSLDDFLGKEIEIEEAFEKNLYDDFFYLYYDSLDKPRMINPHTFTAYSDLGDLEYNEYTEEELSRLLLELERNREVWYSIISRASMLKRLYNVTAPVIPIFSFFDNDRKVSSGKKKGFDYRSILVFEREDVPQQIVDNWETLVAIGDFLYDEKYG